MSDLTDIITRGRHLTSPAWTSDEKAFYRLRDLAAAARVEMTDELIAENAEHLDWKDGHPGLWFET